MRRIALAAVMTAFAAAAIGSPVGAARPTSGVRGVVLDSTCYGPCVVGETPDPFSGPGLHVVIRSLPDRSVAARRAPDDGHFRARLQPGRYKVKAYVKDARAPRLRPCWDGEAKRVRVREDRFRRVRLHVANSCIR